MPWHVPEDLKRFRRLTLGHAVIMGRRRLNRSANPCRAKQHRGHRSPGWTGSGLPRRPFNRNQPSQRFTRKQDAFVIGGAEIYALALPFA